MKKTSFLSQVLIITGLLVLAVFVLVVKGSSSSDSVPNIPTDLPEAQLQRALASAKPILAFYHSTTCEQCKNMMKAMDEAYPEFADKIVLVDVNVYEEYNTEMVEEAGILTIPALIVYDRSGQQQLYIGSLDAQFLREIMQQLSKETMQ
jgi:thiol-disulfide isomerase/thioredoxin